MRLTPGDPIDLMIGKDGNISAAEQAALREEFNLDKPLPAQLGIFLADAVQGDLGTSFTKRKPSRK